MVAIPFPSSSSPGHVNHAESRGRLINCFVEPLGEKQGAKWVRVPGMIEFATSTVDYFRGMFLVGGTLYAAFENIMLSGTSAGGALSAITGTSTIAGTGSVYFAKDNANPAHVYVVSENGAFLLDPTTGLSSYTGGGAMTSQPNSCFALDGYVFFTTLNARCYATDLNLTSMNALSFALIEAKSDTLLRGIAFGGRAFLFGSQSIEVWTDVGASPFPLQRSTTIPFGLMGADAVAGWEDGFGSGLLWVADDGTVRMLQGYTPVKVSTPDVDRAISRDPDKAHLMASVHIADGHPMWTISGQDFTWEYDVGLQSWHERMSWRELLDPDLTDIDPLKWDYNTQRWRGLQTIRAFDKWLVGDRNSGNIYSIDATEHEEGDEPLRVRVE